jgi:glucosamine--fructose-6-phosphate aminotransferase (isomerizing)
VLKAIKKIGSFLNNCRIYVGRRPFCVSAPAIIFLPVSFCQLNCGFAGLMTLKLSENNALPNQDVILADLFAKIKSSNLKKILAGKLSAADYLNGLRSLQAMEKAILEMKQEKVQEFLFFDEPGTGKLIGLNAEINKFLSAEEKQIESDADKFNSADMEIINSRILLFKDMQWILEKDILANVDKIIDLCGMQEIKSINPAAFKKYRKINLLLNALDRLEVRGRDSAGLQITFTLEDDQALESVLSDLQKEGLSASYTERSQPADLLNGSIQVIPTGSLAAANSISVTFTYKTFSIVGELGRNVRELRQIIGDDRILQAFAQLPAVCETAITHTRWASVGSITEENCHPVNNYKNSSGKDSFPCYPQARPDINVVLNGDIDNYLALRSALEAAGGLIAPEITTDTKIIPLQIEKYLKAGNNLAESFRLAVRDFEGSQAIVMTSNLEPGKIFLALKGSGQSVYIGIGKDQYMFSSELYGLVEVMPDFIKMNGETDSAGEQAAGQIYVLDQNSGGGLAGIKACSYEGAEIELAPDDMQRAQITTRDIDRGDYPHFFLKEISESALSVKRTLRGKYRIEILRNSSAKVTFNLGDDIIPADIRAGFRKRSIKKIMIIGHGTAAVAGMAVADAFERYLKGKNIDVTAKVASELSGFLLKDDLADTLVIPITQSGTTTDTNRAVAMAKERGAFIISIVNRRQSDITAKSHGVFYTSDGRDIEMSVASTKAFYSQIIAGQILALFFAQLSGARTDDYIAAELHNLEATPQLMMRVFSRKDQIAASVRKTFDKKFWAVVGSGPNKAAADEIRIKLSELCYKTISSDIVENKKHIDLSAEPLILVCAAGNPEAVVEDIVKDVAIFKAHKAMVVVFAEEGDDRFDKIADAVIPLPVCAMPLPVILNTMAGHLWGYYAACGIDNEALLFREFRNRLNLAMAGQIKNNYSLYERIADVHFRRMINEFYQSFHKQRNAGAFNLLGVKTISDLVLLLKYAAGKLPLEDFRHEFKGDEGLDSPLDILDITLGCAIDELTRPIDAIRHQAKTVTVGSSRKEKVPQGIVFDLLNELQYSAKDLTYKNILAIRKIQPAVAVVKGYTIYKISNLDEEGNPDEGTTLVVEKKGGIARQMASRTEKMSPLMGTKRTIVSTGHVYIGKGKADGAFIVVLPLLGENNFVNELLLIHVDYSELLSQKEKKEVLGYRYNDIRNLVNEYNISWDDSYLEKIKLADLLSEPVEELAGRIKQCTVAGNQKIP